MSYGYLTITIYTLTEMPQLNQIQGCVGCLEIRNFVVKKNIIVWSANIQVSYRKIEKSAAKRTFLCHFQVFCSSFDLESILALQTTKFILIMKFLIFRHPTHPWVRFSSGDILHELFSVISCHGDLEVHGLSISISKKKTKAKFYLLNK